MPSVVYKINYEMQLENIASTLLDWKGDEQYLIFGCINFRLLSCMVHIKPHLFDWSPLAMIIIC